MSKTSELYTEIKGLEQKLFGPLANLISLMGSKQKFPIIHQILVLLGVVPLGRALGALKRLHVFNQGYAEHNIGVQDNFEIHPHVVTFLENHTYLRVEIPQRRVRLAVGTIPEIFGKDSEVRDVSRLLDNDFLKNHGLRLCESQDAFYINESVLWSNLDAPNSSVVILGTLPLNDLKYTEANVKSPPGLLIWKLRRKIETEESTRFLSLESCNPTQYARSGYAKWVFVVNEEYEQGYIIQ
ncbi:MAG: hypothetical protein KBB54_00670 [Candidatus Pacebacteria bacterium]|nr:hypothetical protein [Candidatus Paceibacterota bacterium]MBP9818750.1 hypothetical protein [Candidatus Paceibacterota bacterium]